MNNVAGSVPDTAFKVLANRITEVFPEQIRVCVQQLSDEQLWWRPNEGSNSVANLVIHVSGSLNHYLNFEIGGFEYKRDRPKEFAERTPLSKQQVLQTFEDMVTKAKATLSRLNADRLGDPSRDKRHSIVLEDLISIATHVANHTGQIVWITKALREGSLDNLWTRTHRDFGRLAPAPDLRAT